MVTSPDAVLPCALVRYSFEHTDAGVSAYQAREAMGMRSDGSVGGDIPDASPNPEPEPEPDPEDPEPDSDPDPEPEPEPEPESEPKEKEKEKEKDCAPKSLTVHRNILSALVKKDFGRHFEASEHRSIEAHVERIVDGAWAAAVTTAACSNRRSHAASVISGLKFGEDLPTGLSKALGSFMDSSLREISSATGSPSERKAHWEMCPSLPAESDKLRFIGRSSIATLYQQHPKLLGFARQQELLDWLVTMARVATIATIVQHENWKDGRKAIAVLRKHSEDRNQPVVTAAYTALEAQTLALESIAAMEQSIDQASNRQGAIARMRATRPNLVTHHLTADCARLDERIALAVKDANRALESAMSGSEKVVRETLAVYAADREFLLRAWEALDRRQQELFDADDRLLKQAVSTAFARCNENTLARLIATPMYTSHQEQKVRCESVLHKCLWAVLRLNHGTVAAIPAHSWIGIDDSQIGHFQWASYVAPSNDGASHTVQFESGATKIYSRMSPDVQRGLALQQAYLVEALRIKGVDRPVNGRLYVGKETVSSDALRAFAWSLLSYVLAWALCHWTVLSQTFYYSSFAVDCGRVTSAESAFAFEGYCGFCDSSKGPDLCRDNVGLDESARSRSPLVSASYWSGRHAVFGGFNRLDPTTVCHVFAITAGFAVYSLVRLLTSLSRPAKLFDGVYTCDVQSLEFGRFPAYINQSTGTYLVCSNERNSSPAAAESVCWQFRSTSEPLTESIVEATVESELGPVPTGEQTFSCICHDLLIDSARAWHELICYAVLVLSSSVTITSVAFTITGVDSSFNYYVAALAAVMSCGMVWPTLYARLYAWRREPRAVTIKAQRRKLAQYLEMRPKTDQYLELSWSALGYETAPHYPWTEAALPAGEAAAAVARPARPVMDTERTDNPLQTPNWQPPVDQPETKHDVSDLHTTFARLLLSPLSGVASVYNVLRSCTSYT